MPELSDFASAPVEGIKISEVRVVGELSMLVTFSTGETRVYDAAPLLQMPAFAPLADAAVFEAYRIDHGVLTWCDGDIDIAPETVYRDSFEYIYAA